METNYLEKAKRFLKSSAARVALTIVPLAVAAPQVKATVLAGVDFGGGTAGVFASTTNGLGAVSGAGTVVSLPVLNGIAGAKIAGDWTWFSNGISGATGGIDINAGNSGFGLFSGGSIPLKYDFTIFGPPSGSSYNWILTYTINSFSGGSTNATFSGGGADTQEFSGVGNISVPTDLNSWSVDLKVNLLTAQPFDSMEVLIPNSSLDINPGTPEPAAFVLVAGPAGALLLLRRRKRS